MTVMIRKMFLLCMCLALAACARSSTSRRAEEASGPAFKSSLAVLLENRAELALTPEQVDRFEKMDFTLHEKNIVLQHELEALRAQQKKGNRPWHGGYMGGGQHDLHGGKGGSTSAPPEAERERLQRRERLEQIGSTLRQMQDNDSEAYVQAEKLLTDAQKPRARELFSREREKLLEQLEAIHFQIRKGDY
ncbi:hypothetical protein JQX13_38020 [Archangium violaceum]|uniref:hypothetical protein n=1 Tax=Archangium violaceum TaxID=83451 RepID=UPI00193BCA94|nr:hypothetical protein [Archangium violaceum]QRK05894.1 hypothetical protein JQX13_38020 [Archangium violaceum]